MSGFVKFQLTPALAFMLVSSPQMYELTRSVLGSWVATQDGLPKMGGLVLHAIVFILLVSLLMTLFKSVSYKKLGQS
jgi:hypothetical protein